MRKAQVTPLVLAIALGLCFGSVAAKSASPPAMRVGQSIYSETGSGNHAKWQIENTSFERSDDGAILEIRTVRKAPPDGAETYPGTVDVTAWGKRGTSYNRKLWWAHARADKAEIRGFYLVTTQFGSGDGEDLRSYFDMATGALAFLATTDPIFVQIATAQPARKRVISFVSDRTLETLDFTRRNPKANGLLTMRENGKIVDRLVFTGVQFSPTLRVIDMSRQAGDFQLAGDLTVVGREAVSNDHAWDGLALRVSFDQDDEHPVLTIPLHDGIFMLDGIKLPEGLSVVHATGD